MLSVVIDKLVEVLAAQPNAVLPTSAMGAKCPPVGADLPAIAIALTVDDTRGTGFSRFRRSGDMIVQHSGVVNVQPTSDTFTGDLRALRLAPLPLKKNPASTSNRLGADDVQITNVTTPNSPILYTLVEQPTLATEFKLDLAEAHVIFGAAQTPSDKLQIVHWTVIWRDDILGDTYRGALTLDVWGSQVNQVTEIARNIQTRLKTNPQLLRQKGFQRLQPASLDPAQYVLHAPPTGTPFPVWQQRIAYHFVFEYEEGGELSSGVPIKQIDVDVPDPPESFSIR